MKLILSQVRFEQMPYSGTDVKKAKTYGEVVGILEEYGIKNYRWTKTGGEDILEFPLTYTTSNGEVKNMMVRLEVPQIFKVGRDKREVYMEQASWRVFWWYLKARLEAAFYGVSSLEQEFLYQLTNEKTGERLGDMLMDLIKEGGLDKLALEHKPNPKEINADFKVVEVENKEVK